MEKTHNYLTHMKRWNNGHHNGLLEKLSPDEQLHTHVINYIEHYEKSMHDLNSLSTKDTFIISKMINIFIREFRSGYYIFGYTEKDALFKKVDGAEDIYNDLTEKLFDIDSLLRLIANSKNCQIIPADSDPHDIEKHLENAYNVSTAHVRKKERMYIKKTNQATTAKYDDTAVIEHLAKHDRDIQNTNNRIDILETQCNHDSTEHELIARIEQLEKYNILYSISRAYTYIKDKILRFWKWAIYPAWEVGSNLLEYFGVIQTAWSAIRFIASNLGIII